MEERNRITPLVPEFPRDLTQGLSLFVPLAPRELIVLDLAAGKGEVLAELKAQGYQCLGIEASEENCKLCKEKGLEIICDSCQNLAGIKLHKNIGSIWAGRAFEKVELSQIEHLLNITHLVLPNNSPLFFSIPQKREVEGKTSSYSQDEVKVFLANQGFSILNEWTESGPDGAPWWSAIAISKGELSATDSLNAGETHDKKEDRPTGH